MQMPHTNCPWRFDTTPPDWSPTKEGPAAVIITVAISKASIKIWITSESLGVNTLYFNPIFDAGSNHGYDTQDYYKIDPYFGTQKDWENLVKHANQLASALCWMACSITCLPIAHSLIAIITMPRWEPVNG